MRQLLYENKGEEQKDDDRTDGRRIMGNGFFFCPRCQARIYCSADTTDIQHECSSPSSALNTDDVRNTGAWEDWTGSGGAVGKLNVLGITNKLAGTRAHLQFDARHPPLTKKGSDAQLYRERAHLEFINLKKLTDE